MMMGTITSLSENGHVQIVMLITTEMLMLLKTFCLKRFDKTIVTKTGSGRPLVNSYNLCTATTCKSVVFPESRYFNAVRFNLIGASRPYLGLPRVPARAHGARVPYPTYYVALTAAPP